MFGWSPSRIPREPALRARRGRCDGRRQAHRACTGVRRRAPRGPGGRSGVRGRRELHAARERVRDAPDQEGGAVARRAAPCLRLELLRLRHQFRRGERDERGQPGLALRAYQVESERELLLGPEGDCCVTVLRFATVFGHSRRRASIWSRICSRPRRERRADHAHGATSGPSCTYATSRGWSSPCSMPTRGMRGQIFNVGDRRLNMMIGQLAGWSGERVARAPGRGGRAALEGLEELRVSFEKIRRELGFEAETLMEAGIEEMSRSSQGTYGHYRDPSTRPRDDEAGAPGLPAPDFAPLPAVRRGRGPDSGSRQDAWLIHCVFPAGRQPSPGRVCTLYQASCIIARPLARFFAIPYRASWHFYCSSPGGMRRATTGSRLLTRQTISVPGFSLHPRRLRGGHCKHRE